MNSTLLFLLAVLAVVCGAVGIAVLAVFTYVDSLFAAFSARRNPGGNDEH